MMPTIITLITSILEIIDQLFGSQLGLNVPAVQIVLAAITPVLVFFVPSIPWRAAGSQWPH